MAKSLWDEFKDLFKTDSQKAQEKQNQIDDALEREKSILDQLAQLEKEYKDSLPEEELPDLDKLFPKDSGLKEIEYTPASDEDIAKRAQAENALGKKSETNRLEDRYETQKSNLESGREKAESSLAEGYEKLRELYDDLRRRTENDVLKRGLARSSIATTQLGELDNARMQGASELRASYNSAMSDIDSKIAGLENDKLGALEELDLKYAMQLEDRIAELKQERDKTVRQYEEYNNKVRQQNTAYQSKRESDIEEYLKKREEDKIAEQKKQADYEAKYGYSGAKQENYAKRYDIALDFYSSLAPEIALDALNASPNMKYYLGAYYNKLSKALGSAQGSASKTVF